MLVTFLYDPKLGGGAAQAVYSLAHELEKRGHNIIVVTSGPNKKIEKHFIDGVKIISFFPPNLYWIFDKDNHPLWQKFIWQIIDIWNPFVYKIIKKIVLEEQPDIVHIHKLRGFSPSIWKACKDAGVKRLIQTSHDYEIISPQGIRSGFLGKLITSKSKLLFPYQFFRKLSSRQVDCFTSPSKTLMQYITDEKFFPKAEKFIIPNMCQNVNSNEIIIDQTMVDKRSNNLRVLFLGRLENEKGIWILCHAVQKAILKGYSIELDVAGSGNQEKELREYFTQESYIHFWGFVEGKRKEELLTQCNIVCLPSITPEVFPISALETLAFGKPAIVSSTDGLKEIFVDGKTGFFSKAGDIDELCSLLEFISRNKNILNSMGQNCLIESKKYSPEIVISQFESIYKNNVPFSE